MKSNTTFRVLVNSMPKSGTFLLTRTVDLLGFRNVARGGLLRRITGKIGIGLPPSLIYEAVNKHWQNRLCRQSGLGKQSDKVSIGVTSPIQVPSKLAVRWLTDVLPGHYISGHVPWSAALDKILYNLGYKHLLIIRDPRDVLVSFLHYVLKPDHSLSADFRILSQDERIVFALKGGYAPVSRRYMVGIVKAFQSVTDWKKSQNCLIVRFEDLIGEKGGGSGNTQQKTVKKICDYLEIGLDEKGVTRVCEEVFNPASPTFRQGKVSAWKSELSQERSKFITRSCAQLLKKLQYNDEIR